MFVFDAGYLFGTLNGASNPTPVKFGSMQSVEAVIETKLVPAPMQTKAAIGMQIDGLTLKFKAKTAQISGLLFNQIFFGQSVTTGSQALLKDSVLPIPNQAPYTVTPSVAGTFLQDLGVQYQNGSIGGAPLIRVASNPAAGQYSLAGGVYTFAAADKGLTAVFNCLYQSTGGHSLALANGFKGLAPSFQVVLNTVVNGNQMTWVLNKCISRQIQVVTVLEKYSIPEFSFDAIGDLTPPLGNIGTFSFTDSFSN